jgi:hypothetical protein
MIKGLLLIACTIVNVSVLAYSLLKQPESRSTQDLVAIINIFDTMSGCESERDVLKMVGGDSRSETGKLALIYLQMKGGKLIERCSVSVVACVLQNAYQKETSPWCQVHFTDPKEYFEVLDRERMRSNSGRVRHEITGVETIESTQSRVTVSVRGFAIYQNGSPNEIPFAFLLTWISQGGQGYKLQKFRRNSNPGIKV